MEDNISIIKFIGLPDAFVVVPLILSFIFALAPYLPGKDFGIIKIPQFTPLTRNRLKIIGPVIFLGFVTLFLPLINRVNSSSANQNVANDNRNQTITTNDNKPASSIEIHNQAQQHIARAWDLYKKQGLFQDAIKECDVAIGLEPENQEALALKKDIQDYLEKRNRNN